MQKLIMPIQSALITAGYQNAAYRKRFGFPHYGQDMVSAIPDRSVRASGSGKVLLSGLDSTLGLVLIILYPQAYNHKTGKAQDLVLRYCHLKSISVKVADNVSAGDLLGVYGNTGRYSTGPHLHVEADYDTKYFAYSATVGKSGTIIKAGNASTMLCPAYLLHTKQSAPEAQRCERSKASYGGIPYVMENELPILLA